MEERKAAAGCLATRGTNTEREIERERERERETVNYWWDKEGALYLITAHTAACHDARPDTMPEK